MAKSPNEVRNSAARKLGILGVGQTLQSEYAADLDDAYGELHSQLLNLGAIDFGPTSDVPAAYAPAVASLLAQMRMLEYKPPPERMIAIQNDAQEAWTMIWRLHERPRMGQVEVSDY